MSQKLRILFNTEASFLNSGFANYTRELISRLQASGKYDIAELSSYGFVNDPRDVLITWKYYANAVRNNDPRYEIYNSHSENQFGKWRFDKVVLDFKPHVVIDVRDYWMSYYVKFSPLRRRFHWILMPTVDSAPQQESWVDTFLSADAIFTYSDWGAETLKAQTANKINYIDTTSPGVNLNIFKPLQNRQQARDFLGIPKDYLIVGSVMRNQKRKLIPELILSFKKYLDTIKNSTLKSKTYLYLHTSYPDMGWDIPELLKNSGLSHRVLFTYKCQSCNKISSRVFAGTNIVCPNCMSREMGLSSVSNGIAEQELCAVYNTFDLYVQYAICEGFGMPQVEAAACGVPVCSVNYSAMTDVIKKLHAFSIPISTYFKEMETKAIRVYPDNDSLVNYMIQFFETPESMRNKKRKKIRSLTEKHYNWEHIASKWEDYLDSLNISDLDKLQHTHQIKPEKNVTITNNKMANISNIIEMVQNSKYLSETVDMGYVLDILKNADYGFEQAGSRISQYNMDNATKAMNALIDYNNTVYSIEKNQNYQQEDFIQYAKIKSSL
jgi:glycosyltransferase involved in cell wall biosynthesis